MGRLVIGFFLMILLNSFKAASQAYFPFHDSANQKISLKVLPQNFYTQNLGFFCKKEIQLQKLTSTNLFIRLGSKEYVDYLEQKPNAKNFSKK